MFLIKLLQTRLLPWLIVFFLVTMAGLVWRTASLENRNHYLASQIATLMRERDIAQTNQKRYTQQILRMHKAHQDTEYEKHQATLSSDKTQAYLRRSLADEEFAKGTVPDDPAQRLYQHAETIRNQEH